MRSWQRPVSTLVKTKKSLELQRGHSKLREEYQGGAEATEPDGIPQPRRRRDFF